MSENRAYASLSPGLLARKGQARPAMRPQSFNTLDDLGWNDMGGDAPERTAAAPAVVRQQKDIAEELGAAPEQALQTSAPAAPMAALAPVSRAAGAGKAAFTLRLDAERHLKLRIACAMRGRSAQMIVTEALDAFLKTLPDIDAVAESFPAPLPRPGRAKREVKK